MDVHVLLYPGLALLLLAIWQEPEPEPARTARAAPSAEERAGHRAMLALLEDVRQKTAQGDSFQGDAALKQLEETRAGLDLQTAAPETLARLDYDIGLNLLRLGRNEEALVSLRASYERLAPIATAQRPPFAERLCFDLGVAAMRKGESDNCVARHTAQSCLLPIEEGGRHADEAGSREAIRWLREGMEVSGDEKLRLCGRWLLNIAAMTVGEYPDGLSKAELIEPSVFASEAEFPRFPDVAPALGLNHFDLSGSAILEDFDEDGLLDVLTSSWDTSEALHFHRNRGDGTFEDRSHAANLDGLYGGLNLVHADFDSDGWSDVLVLRGAWLWGPLGKIPKSLLQNRGDGTFLDVTIRAGLNQETFPSQAAGFADHDLDGDLDLYIGAEGSPANPYPGQLFQNQGDGTFRDVAGLAGVENRRFCKGVAWGDYDADRYPDLYCSNLGGKERLYHNRRDGTFEDVAETAGVTGPTNSFPTWFWDFDNDGALDLFVASFELPRTDRSCTLATVAASYLGLPFEGELACLYKGDGKGGFRDVARERNLERLTLPMGSNFGDLDSDGFLDFYLGTGYPAYDGLIPNVLYWNRGGEKFLDVSAAAGVGHLQKGHGVCFGDLDRDGDLDLFEQMGGAYPGDGFGDTLYRNPGFGNHWLAVRLVGVESNRSAIGARIHAELEEGGKRRHLWRWVGLTSSFGSNPLEEHLGLGQAKSVARLEIYWPKSDTTQVFEDVAADRRIELVERAKEYRVTPLKAFRLGG